MKNNRKVCICLSRGGIAMVGDLSIAFMVAQCALCGN